MPTIDQLTDKQFKKLLEEYFVEPKKRSKMSKVEIKELAKILNGRINVPIIDETTEQKILVKIIIKIDGFLYDNLPNEFYDLVRSLEKGIDDNEAKRLIKRLSRLANKNIDIPYVPEPMEYIALNLIIGIIINAARKAWNLEMAKREFVNIEVPNKDNASDNELERLVV